MVPAYRLWECSAAVALTRGCRSLTACTPSATLNSNHETALINDQQEARPSKEICLGWVATGIGGLRVVLALVGSRHITLGRSL